MSQADAQILALVDAALAESRRRAGPWIACRAGCAGCCHAAFPITALDVQRLERGLAGLAPAEAEAIRARARLYVDLIRDTFPGDWAAGRLDPNEEWRDWFFARWQGRAACPALDETSGECLLYEHRPVACRLYGHLIQIGETRPGQCHLCFAGAPPAALEAARVRIDPAAVDESSLPGGGQTLVAFALLTR